MSFREIPCYSKDGSKHILDIKFNWDNSISISERDKTTTLHIDSIDFEESVSYSTGYHVGNEYRFEIIPEDAFFESISFYDSKQEYDSIPYSITLYRQKRSLPNGPNRYGFKLYINKKRLISGKGDRPFFNY